MKPIILLCVFPLFATAIAESAVDFCDNWVIAQLEEKGLHPGYNEESGEFVVVSHSQTRCADPSVDLSVWRFCRDVFLKAHIKARRDVANLVKGSLEASNAVVKMSAGGERIRMRTATIEMNADELPFGVIMLTAEGTWRDGVYAASVAMGWNKEREKQSRDSRSGLIVPSADWEDQMRTFFTKKKIEFIPPSGEFIDSSGFVHLFGAEVDDMLSRPLASRSAAMSALEIRATTNLRLIRDSAGGASFGTLISTRNDGHAGSTAKIAAGEMGSVASGVMPHVVCALEGKIMSESFKRSLYVMVYADDCKDLLGTCRIRERHADTTQSGVQVWNPITGKFENQE